MWSPFFRKDRKRPLSFQQDEREYLAISSRTWRLVHRDECLTVLSVSCKGFSGEAAVDGSNPMVRSFLAVFGHSQFRRLGLRHSRAWIFSRILKPLPGRSLSLGAALAFLVAPTACFGGLLRPGAWFVEAVKYHLSALVRYPTRIVTLT